ncbi:hypothetical protein BSZ14_05245 [Sphingomonas sp. Sph1(2015)]|uniref:bifunctional acetate--CoA ligase family protein/GNAT family N-acetyltransferase n=2 Tax=Alphaproteobacteria TaxID=28211 RepID=UPI000976FBC9|nr:bifunctional acetyl coenzyme A synthetase (ADP forming), alpha domain/GNAT family N-acetyltransferase [Sphingomonas sp. Sph1(2015)]OMJ33067.1 hypothetical protein BSZ14_05245 [Sphingomonas sp. Sph1(2015)]
MAASTLRPFLRPSGIAVIGGSQRIGSVGRALLDNILAAGFPGQVVAVNPHPVGISGVTWVQGIAALTSPPDLAIIACPAHGVVEAVGALGRLGTRAAVIVSGGLTDATMRVELLAAARAHGMRLIGPNSIGLLSPPARLDASFAYGTAKAGRLAFLSQSGALVAAMLDAASARGFGFSGVVSMGDMVDVDLADLIDLYVADPTTDAILIHVEGITSAARFLSAARAATLIKPVIVLKAGRAPGASQAAFSHTGAITGSAEVHSSAFRRSGIVEVGTMADLLDAAQVLGRYHAMGGDRIAVVTNGGGAGVLAADALAATGLSLATLSSETVARLGSGLMPGAHFNPVDIGGDARSRRIAFAVAAVLADPGVDALIVAHCPTAVERAEVMAQAVVRAAKGATRPVIACWLGPADAAAARPVFGEAGIPLFETVEDAVRACGHLHRAAAGRAAALRASPRLSIPDHDRAAAQKIIAAARAEQRTRLHGYEARAILTAYGIPVVAAHRALTPDAVEQACDGLIPPYVVKIDSPDLPHKSDVGGVARHLPSAAAARDAALAMAARIARERPEAHLIGFDVEPMETEPNGIELLVGVADDPVFGPVLAVGAGGAAVQVLDDHAVELPPLDDQLARDMIARTRVSALLAGYRDVPPACIDGVVAVLEAVSTMVADLPDLAELDINPLLVGAKCVIALDVRMRITAMPARGRMAIRPMPVEWAADLITRDGTALHVRPVRADDEALLADLFHHVSPEDLRFRFLTGLREVGRDRLVAMTQLDYARAMHFLAFVDSRLVASAMIVGDADRAHAEVALSVDAGFKGRGISWTLMQHVLAYARAEGYQTIESIESQGNRAALSLEKEMGFATVSSSGGEEVVRRSLDA